MSEQDRALTDVEAAEVLHVHRITVARHIADGSIRSFRVGRCRRVWMSELKAYAERQAEAEAAEKTQAAA